MSKFWFIILSQLLAALIVFFTTDKIFSQTKRSYFSPKWNFPLTKKGVVLVIVFLFIIGLSIWQDFDDQAEKATVKRLNKIELSRRDSIGNGIQRTRDSIAYLRSQQSKNETIDALAQYGLKYDTTQRRIEKLVKDSSRVMIVKGIEPLIKFCANSPVSVISSNIIDSVTIKVCNEGAVSRNITMRFFLFVSKANSVNSYESLEYLFDYKGLITPFSLGYPEWRNFSIPFKKEIENFNLHILVTGSYTNSDGSKTFLIDDALYFDFTTKQHKFPTDRGSRLKEVLKAKGIAL